jgi:hypothetical protein
MMQADLIELARICMEQSRLASNKQVAAKLRRMAKDYQRRAADLDSGKLLDIGEEESALLSSSSITPGDAADC